MARPRTRTQQWNFPLALLDLTLAHSRQTPLHLHSRPNSLLKRSAHALAIKQKEDQDDYAQVTVTPLSRTNKNTGTPTRFSAPGVSSKGKSPELSSAIDRPHLASVLEQRVNALLTQSSHNSLIEKEDLEASEELHYEETELQSLYADLLAHSEESKSVETDVDLELEDALKDLNAVLQAIAQRLFLENETSDFKDSSSGGTTSLSARLMSEFNTQTQKVGEEDDYRGLRGRLDNETLHHRIISRLVDVVSNLERLPSTSQASVVPVTVLSDVEWHAVVRSTVKRSEFGLSEDVLLLCKKFGSNAFEGALDHVLQAYARLGQASAISQLLNKFDIAMPSEKQRDFLVKAHLHGCDAITTPDPHLDKALLAIHELEAKGLAPPIKSYSRAIHTLFRKKSTQYQAQAWDLFSHMRYVAHPTPDVFMYSTMIRACAGTGPSQTSSAADPARALDLWTEMINDAKLEPTARAYNAVILACARSKTYATEAFRLAREMLDSRRDAFGRAEMRPDRWTFVALLVAAKNMKDLGRTRWLLAEMLKMHESDLKEGKVGELGPDEEIFMHVFNAYASYVPPFKRSATKIVETEDGGGIATEKETEPETEIASEDAKSAIDIPSVSTPFGVTPPQSAAEILVEVDILLDRILEDSHSFDFLSSHGPFSRVLLTPRLINAYLSVYYRHAPLSVCQQTLNEVLERTKVEPDARIWVGVLERCAFTEDRHERGIAREFAEMAWEKWCEVENGMGVDNQTARLIERAYVAMIRAYALFRDLDRSLSLVRLFLSRFPPSLISTVPPTSPMRASRTLLYANRPIVRLTSPTDVQDDRVPPLLTFRDLESLHGRLVEQGQRRKKEIGFVKWVSKAYEGHLRKRRERAMKGRAGDSASGFT